MCGERWIGTHECAPVQSKPFKAITEIVRDALRETAKIDPEFRYCARCKEWVRDEKWLDENDKLRAELAAMRAERDHLRKALRLLDHITDGKESSNGTEPEDIQQVVERFVALKAERDDAMAKLAALVEAVSDVCSRGMPGGDSDSAITIYKAEALLRAAIAAARGGAS